MLKDAIIIFRKELRNIFRDKRAVFGNYILPLLLFPLFFFVIGTVSERRQEQAEETIYRLEVRNNDDPALTTVLEKYLQFELTTRESTESTLVVEFPPGYQPGDRAEVLIYFDSTSSPSSFASGMLEAGLREYENELSEEILAGYGISLEELDTITSRRIDRAPPAAQGMEFMVIMIPYLLVIYLFAGSMGIVLDCTAGEKERGSLSLLLVNQVSRTSIALGKILYVITSALVNSTASVVGLLIAVSIMGESIGINVAGKLPFLSPAVVFGLLLTILSLGSIAASIMVFLGSFARSMKEGAGYVMPVYLLALVVGIATMQMDASGNTLLFFIPLVNGIFLLKGFFLAQWEGLNLLVTVGINALVAGVFVYLTSRLYNSEKILNTV